MTIKELKRALVEVKEICNTVADCALSCPFFDLTKNLCPMKFTPYFWLIDDWKEENDAQV